MRTYKAVTAALAAALYLLHAEAWAEDGRVTVIEENDSLYFNSDKHYTQGFRASYLTPGTWEAPFHLLSDLTGSVGVFPDVPGINRREAIFFGQSIFTPKDLTLKDPDPRDRPYAGWLYLGASLLQETGDTFDHVELDLGVVGPASLGEEVQNWWHRDLRNIAPARGWNDQLQNEPGLIATYERFWRVPLVSIGPERGAAGVDLVPQAGASLGNVLTYGDVGALLRFGNNLKTDYGPVHIRPALSGTDYFNDKEAKPFGSYAYVGFQGRAVGHNIFLEGNTYRTSRSVTEVPYVADFTAGVSMFWSSAIRLDFSVLRRTREFEGQPHPDVNGTANLSFSW
jgi:lipid A 3-O-deacylase